MADNEDTTAKIANDDTSFVYGFQEIVDGIVAARMKYLEARKELLEHLGYQRVYPGDIPARTERDHRIGLSIAREHLCQQLGLFASQLVGNWPDALRIFSTVPYKASPDCLGNMSNCWAEISAISSAWETCWSFVDCDFDDEEIQRVSDDRVKAILANATILIALMRGFCKRAGLEAD